MNYSVNNAPQKTCETGDILNSSHFFLVISEKMITFARFFQTI